MLVYLVRNGFPVTDFWFISRSWTLQIMFGQSASLNTWEGIIDLKVVGYHNLPLELFLVRCICFWRPTILQMDASWPMWRNLWQAIIIWKRVLFIYAVLPLTVFIAIIHLIDSEKIVVLVLISNLHLSFMFPYYIRE